MPNRAKIAFDAGREYHNPSDNKPVLRWKNFDAWIHGLETHYEYGKEVQRPCLTIRCWNGRRRM